MARPTAARKQKTFPALDAPIPEPAAAVPDSHSDQDTSEDDSDVPEAETLSGGRAAANAREDALARYQQRLKEKRAAKNKAQEEFIQSTKSKVAVSEQEPDVIGSGSEDELEGDSGVHMDKNPIDSFLESRMARALQDAANEDDSGSSEDDADSPITPVPVSSVRLPDSIFAAAAAAHGSIERKRAKKASSKVQTKKRRIREAPAEQVINGRTIRVITPLDAPPPVSPHPSHKRNRSTKGGAAFRQKWKKLDALRAQIRSRTGPPRNFATTVQ